jgi:enoyl-CoA hydratase
MPAMTEFPPTPGDARVSYEFADGVATITMDDGKVNAISVAMQAAVGQALDQAEADGAAVVLAGRPGRFSAGFDLATLAAGGEESAAMVAGGWALAARLVAFPAPVVAACTGHAVALGALLMCACDYRIGAAGSYKIMVNEVAIGIPMPAAAVALLRDRLHPSAVQRAAILAEVFTPDDAVAAGWLDRVVAPEQLLAAAQEHARSLATLNRAAHHATKIAMRQSTLDTLRAGPATLGLTSP